MYRYVIETQTKNPRTCSNFLWLNPSPFCASSLSHFTFFHVSPQFNSSTKVNNSLCWDFIVAPVHGSEVLLGSLLFRVASLIPRYVQYIEILNQTKHPYYSDDAMHIMSYIQVHTYAARFPSFVRFDTHGRLGEQLEYPGKLIRILNH